MVILATTSGSGEWKTENYGIDIFTSASRMNKLESLVSDILARIKTTIEDES
ncbi:hypothetical protein KAX08_07275 [candidate division WOR-3 bacterium]|nr:hypothetical protein [candidate division WOR-3 bacterium]